MISKRLSKLALIVLLIGNMTLITGCSSVFNGDFTINSANQLKKEDAMELIMDKTSIEDLKKINVNTNLGNIELLEGDAYYVEINYLYWKEKPIYTLEDGVLTFDDSKALPSSYSINFDLDNYIRIYLPKDANLDTIHLDTASGNINASGFIADSLDITVSYGNLSISKATAKDADITLSSGNSDLKEVNAKKLEYSNSYGNATFEHVNKDSNSLISTDIKESEFEISMSSGNCTFDDFVSGSLEINNSYGNVSCNKSNMNELSVNLSSGNLDVTKSLIEQIDVKNSYGDVTLSLAGKEEEYMLDIETSYGDIEVENQSYEGHLTRENNGDKNIIANLSSGDIDINFE